MPKPAVSSQVQSGPASVDAANDLKQLSQTVAQNKAFSNLIDGTLCEAQSGDRIDVVCPSDGEVFASICASQAEDVDSAVTAAGNAYRDGDWGKMSAMERGRILSRLASLIEANSTELAALESRDTGKPLRQGIADIAGCARYFEYYGGAADKVHGDTIPVPEGFTAMTLREPHGVVGGIIPWNYPAQILGRVAGAGLAMGNSLVIKPAEDACLSVLRVAELALEAGLPNGAFNVVTGLGSSAGAALSSHPGVDFVTFTGSPATGTAIQQAAANSNIGVTMELGGKSPQILFEDADIDVAMPFLVNAIIQNGGQTCSAGSRILVHERIHQDVLERLAEAFSKLVAGPHYADTDLGAIISQKQHERVEGFVTRASNRDGEIVARGSIAANVPEGGFYTKPVLFDAVNPDSELGQDEVFGPVLSVMKFKDEADAARLANGTEYGLVAAVWTRDGARQLRMAKAVRSGQVFINGYGAGGGIELPFGGFKRSGHGREKGFEGLLHMSATKTVVFNHGV